MPRIGCLVLLLNILEHVCFFCFCFCLVCHFILFVLCVHFIFENFQKDKNILIWLFLFLPSFV
jgi:hypothetical protein